MGKIIPGIFLSFFLLMFFRPSYAGPKWEMGDDSWMQLSFLGQFHMSYQDDAPEETDFFLRRGRIILTGQILDGVNSSTDIQDAFIDVRIADANHWVKAGLILLPFSMENFSSAASLLGLDYNSEIIKLTNTFVWRDYGVSFHGGFGKKFAYRAGIFDGYDMSGSSKNPDAELRFTGHMSYSLIGEVETGWFFTQDKLGKKGDYLAIGAGVDYQEDAVLYTSQDVTSEIDSRALVVDIQSNFGLGSIGMGEMDLTVNGAVYEWDNANFDGITAFAEAGFRVGHALGTLKLSTQRPDDGDDIDDITFGLHYFLKGHNARAGVEFRTGDSDDMVLAGIQFLL